MTRAALCIATALALSACLAPARPAPTPPSATTAAPPAGYRTKTPQGVDLVFDARRGVFAVAGLQDHYWVDQRFYRRGPAGWLVAPAPDGPWSACPPAELPAGLGAGDAK